jgi:hypothetical protein
MPKGDVVRYNRQRPNAGTVSGLSSAPVALGSTVITPDPSGAPLIDKTILLGPDGGFFQGSFQLGHENDFAYPDTALRIWSSVRADGSLIGTIAGYKDATLQWSSNTDGQLVAGAGAVVLDEDGITADAGSIAGWSITSEYLGGGDTYLYPNGDIVVGSVGDLVRMSSSHATYRLWAGAYAPEDAPFSVTKAGYLYAKKGGFGGTALAPAIVLDDSTGQVKLPGIIHLGSDPSHAVLFDGSAVTPALESVGFATGSTGWHIDADGNAEFNSLVARGSLEAAGGNVTIDDNGIAIAAAGNNTVFSNTIRFIDANGTMQTSIYHQRIVLDLPEGGTSHNEYAEMQNIGDYSRHVSVGAIATGGQDVATANLYAAAGGGTGSPWTNIIAASRPATGTSAITMRVEGTTIATLNAAGLTLTGALFGSTAIGARVYRSTTQSIGSGSYAALSWDTELADTDSCWAAANPTHLTATHAGYYNVGAHVTWASAPSVVWYIRIRDQDGNTIAANTYLAGAIVGGITAGMVYLAAGDYVTVEVYQNSGAAINLRAGTTAQQDYNTGWLQRVS